MKDRKPIRQGNAKARAELRDRNIRRIRAEFRKELQEVLSNPFLPKDLRAAILETNADFVE